MKTLLFAFIALVSSSYSFAKCNSEMADYIQTAYFHYNLGILHFDPARKHMNTIQNEITTYDQMSQNGVILGNSDLGKLSANIERHKLYSSSMQMDIDEVTTLTTDRFNALQACMRREVSEKCAEALNGMKSEFDRIVVQITTDHFSEVKTIYSLYAQYGLDMDQSIIQKKVLPRGTSFLNATGKYLKRSNRLQEVDEAIKSLGYSVPVAEALNCENQQGR